ncbi:hypothetical protein [Arthrobacter methylotrophus]
MPFASGNALVIFTEERTGGIGVGQHNSGAVAAELQEEPFDRCRLRT